MITSVTTSKWGRLATLTLLVSVAGPAQAMLNNPLLSPKRIKELSAKTAPPPADIPPGMVPPLPVPAMPGTQDMQGMRGVPQPLEEPLPQGLEVSVIAETSAILRYPQSGANQPGTMPLGMASPMPGPMGMMGVAGTPATAGSAPPASAPRTRTVLARQGELVRIERGEYRVRIQKGQVLLTDSHGKVAWTGGVESTETAPRLIDARSLAQPDSSVATRITPGTAAASGTAPSSAGQPPSPGTVR